MSELSIMEYVESYMHKARQKTISYYTGDTLKSINAFELRITGLSTINGIISDKFEQTIIQSIFTNATIRDYVSNTSARFYSFILSKYEYKDIVDVVVESISENTDSTNCLIPKELSDRLPKPEEIFNKLINNKWLLFIVLFFLCTPNISGIKENESK